MIEWDRFARLYDDDYGDFVDDLDLYLPFAERTGGPILEAMCGTGRVLLPLAEAKLLAAGISEHARAETGDICSVRLPERFALAIVAMNSFMHLPTGEAQRDALRTLHDHLRPGGVLLLDLFNPDPHELIADEGVLVHAKSFTSSTGTGVQKWVLRRTDFANQTHYVEFVYDEIGPDRLLRRDVMPFTMRWLYRFELELLLEQAGLVLEGLFGSYDLDDYTSGSDRLIAVAQRP
jgi:SAM-dependent methyltransferase